MFAWAKIPEPYLGMGSLEFSKLLLREAKVAVSPGIGFGEGGDEYVRFALVENEHRIFQAVRGNSPGIEVRRRGIMDQAVKVGLIGFGTVGSGVVKILQK